MDTYDKCPKKYHYRYIEKVEIEQKTWSHTEFGSCAHKILELFHQRILDGESDPEGYSILMKRCFVDAVKEFNIEVLEETTWSPQGEKPGVKYLREIMQDYLDGIRKDGLPPVVGIEEPFSFNLDEHTLVRGFIDRVDFVEPGVYRVVDYKTSKDGKYLSGFQLLVYAEALRRKYPDLKKVLGSYMLLKHKCKTIDFEFSLDDIRNCETKMIKKASSIKIEDVWVKKPTPLCGFCDYKSICQDAVWVQEEE